MRRREFITLLLGSVVASPLVVRAQQPTRVRRIGVLMNFSSDAPEGQKRVAAFTQALQKLGWNEGDNVRTDVRWAGDDPPSDPNWLPLLHGQAASGDIIMLPEMLPDASLGLGRCAVNK
jgi:hypothetical protein